MPQPTTAISRSARSNFRPLLLVVTRLFFIQKNGHIRLPNLLRRPSNDQSYLFRFR
ncbi:hypothetical protein VIBNISO65_1030061 [Vibrio nigripulchritudo SO65]|nr:hypothetical protein VIBNIAM115_1400002 [Vibrio nigripulchritudo AM115]CCN67045.1 hypothetical protein VIBNIPon4_680060 [Vibrio nigripulchritudo POn4]CCN74190.1 hypothetical protein VIBNISO65_1030061 [Vibrio nigripulchritudo SO65]